jgi:hypothetical protein
MNNAPEADFSVRAAVAELAARCAPAPSWRAYGPGNKTEPAADEWSWRRGMTYEAGQRLADVSLNRILRALRDLPTEAADRVWAAATDAVVDAIEGTFEIGESLRSAHASPEHEEQAEDRLAFFTRQAFDVQSDSFRHITDLDFVLKVQNEQSSLVDALYTAKEAGASTWGLIS